ncbi:11235_t:CDS:2 [Acaulospora morrowiae]|uniref:11235_t:CDS:1 n=1 Tax=Acaulospora morrowiae TaxID=94023 RepID=A0A9N9ABE2_9GLOM|nr:11235_t:CDS:2 [Acaulospora morrowiae]
MNTCSDGNARLQRIHKETSPSTKNSKELVKVDMGQEGCVNILVNASLVHRIPQNLRPAAMVAFGRMLE